MMFEDREKVAERRFEREQELAFQIAARRNRLMGLWAAGQMGLTGEAATSYAMALVKAEVNGHGDGRVIEQACHDLVARGYIMSEMEVSRRLTNFAAAARRQILEDGAGNDDPRVPM
jgi:hypothetical protein